MSQRTVITNTLEVSGKLWSGATCNHTYVLTAKPLPTTMAEARKLAGDFESLKTAKVITTVQEISEVVSEVSLSPTKDHRSPGSAH